MLEFFCLFIVVALLCAFICIPIMIAGSRGINDGRRVLIAVLSWLGIFFGVTWVVALVLSLAFPGENCACCGDNLDRLATLSKLYRDKAITKSEYETMKAKLLGTTKK